MPVLEALRALSSFTPPRSLPPCDLAELADLLEAHGLAPLASYHLEGNVVGAGLPAQFREKLLALYQGVVNDNVFKVMTLRRALTASPVPVVVLGGLAAVDWLYPHLAFRPLGDLRMVVRAEDAEPFAAAARQGGFSPGAAGAGGRTLHFTDGKIGFDIQEGLWPGAPADPAILPAASRVPALGPHVFRPSPEDALLATVAEQAETGLMAPLLGFVDLREILALAPPPDPAVVRRRAAALGLTRALLGSMRLLASFFPGSAAAAAALEPELPVLDRAAVEAVVHGAGDPRKLTHLRGAAAAARAVVAPRRSS